MTQHAKLSASQTKEWGNCAGQLAMISMLPEGSKSDTNDMARLGTCAHALLERCLTENVLAGNYTGRIISIVQEGTDKEETIIQKKGFKLVSKPGVFQAIVDQDMEEAVDQAVEYVRRRLMELFGNPDTKHAVEKGYMRLEQRLTILVDRDDSFGTGDIILDAWPIELEIVDYKHGERVAVEIFDHKGPNLQLQSYALGTAEQSGWDYQAYKYTVVQPRCPHSDGRVRDHDATAEELQSFKVWLGKAATRVDEAFELMHDVGSDLPFNAGTHSDIAHALFSKGFLTPGEHCKWCKAKYNRASDLPCPGIVAETEKQAEVDFMDDPGDFDPTPPEDPAELARLLKWEPMITGFFKAVKAHANQMIRSGTDIPDFKLVAGKSAGRKLITLRQATDTETGELVFEDDGLTPMMVEVTDEWLVDQLKSRFQVTDDTKLFNPRTLRTGPQLEKEVPKGELRKAFDKELLYKQPGQLTMVPATDPRPAEAPPAAADDFPVEDEDGEVVGDE